MNASVRSPSLRLLFISSLAHWGGRERWLVQAANGLAARGHDVQVVVRPGTKLMARAAEAGLSTLALRADTLLSPRSLFHMQRLLSRQRPHAVFLLDDAELRMVALCTWAGWRPLIFRKVEPELDSPIPPTHPVFLRRVTRFLTSSRPGAAWIRQKTGVGAGSVRVLRDGIGLSDPPSAKNRELLRRKLKLPGKSPLVLHVGKLEARKGQVTTLHALARLKARATSVPTLAFVGTGDDESRLHDLVHELGLREHVLWVGFRTNVASYMGAADFLVLPTQRPGISWTLLEAMAQQIPVIASNVDGIDELIEDGVNGLLVPPEDAESLARAMECLLQDGDLARRLALLGRATIQDGWGLDAMLDELESLVWAHRLRERQDSTRPGLFVDRDDTLIRNVPYNGNPQRVSLLPGAARALRWIREAGLPVVVVSNQSGVAQGLHGMDDVHAVHARMRELLQRDGADLDAVYFCPHHPDVDGSCSCRKPEPGLLLQAAQELGIDLGGSLMVGNAARDLEAGRRAGTAVLGFTGAGVASDLPPGERACSSWTALVRDFLRDTATHSPPSPPDTPPREP